MYSNVKVGTGLFSSTVHFSFIHRITVVFRLIARKTANSKQQQGIKFYFQEKQIEPQTADKASW